MERSRWVRIALVGVLGIFAFVGLGSWALASPVGAAPDDDFHLASIWCAWGEEAGQCEAGASAGERAVPAEITYSALCFAKQPEQSAACAVSDDSNVSTARGNFANSYPPIFYATMGTLVGDDVATSTIMMRMLNALIFVLTFATLFVLLRPGQRGPLFWSAVVTLIPLGVFLIPSVNPSSWAILSGLGVWLATYGYFTAQSRGRRIALAVLAVLLGVMGAGSRGDAAVYVAVAAVVATVLTFEKSRAWARRLVLPGILIVIGAFFFLSSNQATGAAAVGAAQDFAEPGVVAGAADSPFSLLVQNILLLPSLWAGNLGTWGLGWIDTKLPATVFIVMIGVFFAVVFWGVHVLERRKAIALAIVALTLAVFPLYVLHGMQARIGDEVQPRYVLPLLVMFAGVALMGMKRDDLGLGRLQGVVVVLGVSMANALALHTNMRRYITGEDVGSLNLNLNKEWWWSLPIEPMTVWIAGSASFALFLLGMYALLFSNAGRKLMPQEIRQP